MGRSGNKTAANRQARGRHARVVRGSRREHAPTATPRSIPPDHLAHLDAAAASESYARQAPRQIEWPPVDDPCPAKRSTRRVPYEKSLQHKFEAIAAEWHPTLNGGLRPEDVSAGARTKRWWLCPGKLSPDGTVFVRHAYQATTSNRTNGKGCPYCSTRPKKACPYTNSLRSRNPEIATELHPTRNTKAADAIIAGENKKYWWLCPGKLDAHGQWHQHEYEASPSKRIKGKGCPCCSKPAKKPCPRCNTLSAKYPDLAKELHPTRNTKTADEIIAGDETKYWWLCPGNLNVRSQWHQHEYEASPNNRIHGTGCPECHEIRRMRHWPQALQQALVAADLDELASLQSERKRRRWLVSAGAARHGRAGARIIFEGIVRGFVNKDELSEFVQMSNPEALTAKLRQKSALVKLVEREPVSERVRKQVRARDHGRCCLCSSIENLEVDHLLPVSLGGTNNLDNLWTLCRKCNGNGGKGIKLPTKRMLEVWVATGRGKPACWDDVWEGTGKTPAAWPREPESIEQPT